MQNVRVHPTADVSPDTQVGEGSSIWHQAQVREGAYVDFDARLGDSVKIQNYVSDYWEVKT